MANFKWNNFHCTYITYAIYRWTNIQSGKSYIGSAVNLSKRFHMYYSLKRLLSCKSISLIYQALLIYGHSQFRLEILEYCEPSNVIAREQHYLNVLTPEYNICKQAGSSFGRIVSEETRAKLRSIAQGRNHSEDAKPKMKVSWHTKDIAIRDKSIANLSAGPISNSKAVLVTNIQTGDTDEYDSQNQAARELKTNSTNIINYIKSGKLFKGIWRIEKKTPNC